MINILLNTLNIVLILIAVILVSFGLIVLFIYLHIKSNINSKQIIMNNKLDSIYLVLNEKYRLIKEKVILIIDIDKNEKMLEELKEVDDNLNKIANNQIQVEDSISLIQYITIELRKIDGDANNYSKNLLIEDLNKIEKINMQIAENEEYIQSTRRIFNSNAFSFNHYISIIPNNFVAKSMKIKSYEYFHLEDITAEYNSIKFD